jgi:tetratricopeptide (TPR) repeat protein
MTTWTYALALAVMLSLTAVRSISAQSFADVRKLYDAGQYDQVVSALGARAQDDQQWRVTYLAAMSLQKLSRSDDARKLYERLTARDESDPWRDVGRSALAVIASNAQEAVDAANRAVEHGDSLPEAHFQRGLALNKQGDMAGGAAAFDKASQLDPEWAYAHYYAGLLYSKAKRVDLTASHFDRFLRLAPQAPERAEVQSIMRTLNGR